MKFNQFLLENIEFPVFPARNPCEINKDPYSEISRTCELYTAFHPNRLYTYSLRNRTQFSSCCSGMAGKLTVSSPSNWIGPANPLGHCKYRPYPPKTGRQFRHCPIRRLQNWSPQNHLWKSISKPLTIHYINNSTTIKTERILYRSSKFRHRKIFLFFTKLSNITT